MLFVDGVQVFSVVSFDELEVSVQFFDLLLGFGQLLLVLKQVIDVLLDLL